SLWSFDLFRCESAMLRTYWILVVMDQFTRRIVGFAVHRGFVDGMALCLMFNRAIRTKTLPKYLSSDHDPLYRFHQWQANLRVLDEIGRASCRERGYISALNVRLNTRITNTYSIVIGSKHMTL